MESTPKIGDLVVVKKNDLGYPIGVFGRIVEIDGYVSGQYRIYPALYKILLPDDQDPSRTYVYCFYFDEFEKIYPNKIIKYENMTKPGYRVKVYYHNYPLTYNVLHQGCIVVRSEPSTEQWEA